MQMEGIVQLVLGRWLLFSLMTVCLCHLLLMAGASADFEAGPQKGEAAVQETVTGQFKAGFVFEAALLKSPGWICGFPATCGP